MPTFTEVLPVRKASRHNALAWVPNMQRPGCGRLTIHTDRASCNYRVTRFPAHFAGTAFHFEKDDGSGESYDVFLGTAEKLCDCRGFTAHGHCKHADSAEAIVREGWDTLSLTNPDQDVSATESPF